MGLIPIFWMCLMVVVPASSRISRVEQVGQFDLRHVSVAKEDVETFPMLRRGRNIVGWDHRSAVSEVHPKPRTIAVACGYSSVHDGKHIAWHSNLSFPHRRSDIGAAIRVRPAET